MDIELASCAQGQAAGVRFAPRYWVKAGMRRTLKLAAEGQVRVGVHRCPPPERLTAKFMHWTDSEQKVSSPNSISD